MEEPTEVQERRDEGEEEMDEVSMESRFEDEVVLPWKEQLTFRAFVVSFILGTLFSVIVMKLNLTTGIIPSLNVAAGLLGFFFVKTWTKLLEKVGILRQPFTRQENTVIQTCVVACSGIAFSGGFGSYLFGMSKVVASKSSEGNNPINIKEPGLGWMICFLFIVSFIGLFSVVPLRKIMIIDFNLTYPSGTATAYLINGFHTPTGAKQARKQVGVLGRFFSFSFLWGFIQWFYTAGDDCGFASFPTFGLKAYANRFYFDFSSTYVGTGMLCPYIVNISLLLGSILSWGILWPIIDGKAGDWYSADLPKSSLHSLNGYKIFISIALILGDGLFNFVTVMISTANSFRKQIKNKDPGLVTTASNGGASSSSSNRSMNSEDRRRIEFFMKDGIPLPYAIVGYVAIMAVATPILPRIIPQLKWYYILVMYLIAPALAFSNSYGCGLTDWSLASTYGKLAIFVVGALAGPRHGGVLAGLAGCGVMMSIVSTASDLMQDFKTGYLTLASPRSMFVSQVAGTAMGCVIAPSVFWLFHKAFDVGSPTSEYQAPYATLYRNISILGVEGLKGLPAHCFQLCCVFFVAAVVLDLLKCRLLPKKWAQFVPIPMALAIPFYVGGYFAVDMCIGSLILYAWERVNKAKARALSRAVASGLICGDGLWTLPASVLSLAGVNPPMCMKFLSAATNARVDKFLAG
ncbi:putative metal-nicotianamine transporter [Nymphaea thermarum]|nr:putative metal-nicotianamine transporter [Nymphaea thermarum]